MMRLCNIRRGVTAAVDAPRQTRASQALFRKLGGSADRLRHGELKECAGRTSISRSRLSRIAAGKAFPRADEGARLVEEGIPIHWWNEDPLDNQAQTPKPTGTES